MLASILVSAGLLATAFAAPAPAPFQLKTYTHDARFNNKCVVGYHTGAGLAAATLEDCTKTTPLYTFNGTALASNQGAGSPVGVQVIEDTSDYERWLPVTVNYGQGTSNLQFSDNKFTGFKQSDGAGFIVCDWSLRGTPQVFSVVGKDGLVGFSLPSSCATVALVKN